MEIYRLAQINRVAAAARLQALVLSERLPLEAVLSTIDMIDELRTMTDTQP